MDQVFTVYSLFFFVTALVSFFVAFSAWQRKHLRGAKEFTLLMIAAGIWAFWIIFETAATTMDEKIFYSKLEYIGALSTPVLYLIFVFRFVGNDKFLSKKNILLLFLIPAFTLLLTFTNGQHNLIWSGYSPIRERTNIMEYYHGPGFWIGFLVYSYLLFFVSTIYLSRFIFRQSIAFRFQGWIILVAGLFPWSASVVYLIDSSLLAGVDVTPVSIVLSGALFVYAILYRHFLDLVPVARETLVETLPDGILALDEQNRIQDINTAALIFLGIESKNIIGVSAEVSGASNALLLNAAIGTNVLDQVEIEANNELKTFSISKYAINNQPGSRLVIIRDITEQVRQQSEIREADERYRHIYSLIRMMADNMPDMLWAKDLDKKFIFANKSVCENLLHATDTDEPIGKSQSFFAERERQKYPGRRDWYSFGELCQDSDEVTINSGKSEHFDEFGNVFGKFLYLDVRKAPIYDANGVMIGIVGSARDVTAQKKSMSEIYKRDRLLDAISDATALLVQGENLEESINGALEIIGIATEVNRVYIFKNYYHSGINKPMMSQSHEWTDGSVDPQIDKAELQNVAYELVCPHWLKTLLEGEVIAGNIREFSDPERTTFGQRGIKSILLAPVFINKNFWGFIGFDDCHIERSWTSTEEHLLAAAANTIGAAYLRKKSQDELIAAKERAEESDRLKSAFLANMSHEIRTPMNGILGFAGLLTETKLTGEEQQEYINIIRKSGTRMLNIINDIISISKVEAGQMDISVSETNINSQVEYIYNFFKPEAQQKGVQLDFKTSLSSEEAVISTDKEKIYAILTNLVKNALKFTDDGRIEFGYILKSSRTGEHEQLMLEFFVKDTGAGIGEEQQKFIFERFRQGSESLNRNYEGAGLGLTISKAFVQMLGGEIWLESIEGKGSEFYFTIPYKREMNGNKATGNSDASKVTLNSVTNLKILIADDDKISLKLISTVIKAFGREIITAENGVEAVELCRNHPDIDLVMMDIKMPEMDGYEATRRIRQFNHDVIIVAQSAFALIGDREKAIEAGCNDYLTKPINKTKLVSLIRKYFLSSKNGR